MLPTIALLPELRIYFESVSYKYLAPTGPRTGPGERPKWLCADCAQCAQRVFLRNDSPALLSSLNHQPLTLNSQLSTLNCLVTPDAQPGPTL
jgi:hypothetical protein